MAGGMQQGELDTARLLAAMQQQREQPPGPSLSQVLKPELLLPILRHPDLLQARQTSPFEENCMRMYVLSMMHAKPLPGMGTQHGQMTGAGAFQKSLLV